MPSRKDVFQNGGYYHVYNKTIDSKIIFSDEKNSQIFIEAAEFYKYSGHHLSFSTYRKLPGLNKQFYRGEHFLDPAIKIAAYTLMPNHYHFLLRQQKTNGIVKFMANLVNSFTRYFNILNDRKGPLLMTQFQSVQIRTQEQLLYTSKYIHLNPVKAKIVANLENLRDFKWTSLHDYMQWCNAGIVDASYIMKYFNNTPEEYWSYLKLKKS